MIRSLVTIFLLALCGSVVHAEKAAPKTSANSTNRIEVIGMTCEGCVKGVSSELRRVPGVVSVSVTLSNNLAVVAVDTNKVSTKTLVKTIEEAGYKAKPKK